jgi:uncharacterized protein
VTTRVFVDTSALYAVLASDDPDHIVATSRWHALLDQVRLDPTLAVTHSAVVTEVAALVQRRLGMAAVRDLFDVMLPTLEIESIDERTHGLAVAALLAAGRRQISLVDWTSFTVMRERSITHAFAFDDDFESQGFETFVG